MSNTKTEEIARLFTELNFVEMMSIARDFSNWTRWDINGDERSSDDPSIIDATQMAYNLSDWAVSSL